MKDDESAGAIVAIQIPLDRKPAQVAVLRPGDRLVLRYDRQLTAAEAHAIRERLKTASVRAALIVEADEMDISHD